MESYYVHLVPEGVTWGDVVFDGYPGKWFLAHSAVSATAVIGGLRASFNCLPLRDKLSYLGPRLLLEKAIVVDIEDEEGAFRYADLQGCFAWYEGDEADAIRNRVRQ